MANKIREFAEDDRVIGIPHTMTTAGDKVYIINGRVMTGWSMYFSLTCIKSPEPYGQIVDIVYNTPYPFAAVQKRAALSLGARFDIVDDPSTTVDNEVVDFSKKLVERLNVNTGNFLKKVSAHLDIYGNSYVHIRYDNSGLPSKLTILQPERLKIFLDPMTTKILFYVYLPPIIGGTVLTPYPYDKPNPNLIQNIALTYPTPIIIPPNMMIHLKQQNWTEYPFGYSLLKSCMEPAQARLDYTIISPIIYKHYSKPIIHWKLDPTGLNPAQITSRMTTLKGQLEDMEPTSDLITTNKWESTVITGVSKGFSSAMDMISDADTQIFAALGVPETYFKPRGTTDRMLAEQDKTFIKEMKDRQEYFFEELKTKLLYPAILTKFANKYEHIDDVPRIKAQWRKMIMTDESIEIQNTIALLQSQIIDINEARRRLSLPPTPTDRQNDIMNKVVTGPNDALNKLLASGKSTPMMEGGPGVGAASAAPGAALAPQAAAPSPPNPLFQDKSDPFQARPGETEDDFFRRIEATRPARVKTNKIETADDFGFESMHIEGKAGEKPDDMILKGEMTSAESISSRKCPYCSGSMFVSQDRHKKSFRCQKHGIFDMEG
jgi:hypothetical protein